jgi:hypothetical protein
VQPLPVITSAAPTRPALRVVAEPAVDAGAYTGYDPEDGDLTWLGGWLCLVWTLLLAAGLYFLIR